MAKNSCFCMNFTVRIPHGSPIVFQPHSSLVSFLLGLYIGMLVGESTRRHKVACSSYFIDVDWIS